MLESIIKKRDGEALTHEEYQTIINGFIQGEIPSYQMAAFLMAVYFKGLNREETAILTDVMMHSGEIIDLSDIPGVKVDKHSTGGVGDKTTLVLAPLVAAAGVPVAKMSGRGLGHTGGTLDKLESIKGLSVAMSKEDFIEKVKKHHIAVCGQTADLVPADKKLYALRDVTGTVENLSLIASSIMSKKLACGADAIVLDIKVGYGSTTKDLKEAEHLAEIMKDIGAKMNRKVSVFFTAMFEPLGYAIGNALEVKEAIDTLKGKGPEDLTQLCLELGGEMLVLGEVVKNRNEGIKKLKSLIDSGKAFNKFEEFVKSQGGDLQMIEDPNLLPNSKRLKIYKSKKEGYITELNALDIGLASVKLGAGRETKQSSIDFGAGIILNKKIGDYVKKDETLATLYSNNPANFAKAKTFMDLAYTVGKEQPKKQPLILKSMT